MTFTKLIPPRPAGYVPPPKPRPEPYEHVQPSGTKLLLAYRVNHGLGRYTGLAKPR